MISEIGMNILLLLLLGAVSHGPIAMAQTPGPFSVVGDMTTPRVGHTATLLTDGTVLIAGGFALPSDESSRFSGEPPLTWSSAELYDPQTRSFRATGNMTTPRNGHTATLLPDGKVLIAGGRGPTLPAQASAELYDPATKSFTPTGDMAVGRTGHAATLLPNGQVLIVGGYSEGYATDLTRTSAELYDPSTGAFSPTGNLVEPDAGSWRATLLASGKVLITGGFNYTIWPIHEKYDFSTVYSPSREPNRALGSRRLLC